MPANSQGACVWGQVDLKAHSSPVVTATFQVKETLLSPEAQIKGNSPFPVLGVHKMQLICVQKMLPVLQSS